MSNSERPKRTVYSPTPDYTQPLLQLSKAQRQRLLGRLTFLYGEAAASQNLPELERLLKVHNAYKLPAFQTQSAHCSPANRFTEQDLALITYGDILISESASPLATLANFLDHAPGLKGVFNTLHILPFFPYSSDRGFSITDFKSVDPNVGSWQDIELLSQRYRLMFDGVFNHASSQSMPFQEMLNGNPAYQNFATVYHSPDELTSEQRAMIVRPRTSDILTQYQSIDGPIWVWTTFSPDQIDLNFTNPKVLLEVIDTLLLYVRRGADIIRLDAVTYLWEEPGTPCANLAQTHEVIRLFRDVLDIAAPPVALTTETNIPHEENVTYFGNGYDEAQMVYNFALPPLVLYTFYQEETTELSKWVNTLTYPSDAMTFFNILDTHDGIGLLGVKNILSETQIGVIIRCAREHGALISYRTAEGNIEEPYEINSTWFSVLNLDGEAEDLELQVKRVVASRSIALVLRGVPGIYLHGLMGTHNNIETVLKTKVKRDINRTVIHYFDLQQDLKNSESRVFQMIAHLGRLLDIRVNNKAFHPNGNQKVLRLDPSVFALLRISPDCEQHILTLTNVTPRRCRVSISLDTLGVAGIYSDLPAPVTQQTSSPVCAIPQDNYWYDLIGRRGWRIVNNSLEVTLAAYDVAWLIPLIELERMIE
ncbi:MAG: alpha-amylase family glycosyl hydrolase [Leptolyngbyaceae cyanobacterium]